MEDLGSCYYCGIHLVKEEWITPVTISSKPKGDNDRWATAGYACSKCSVSRKCEIETYK